MENDYFYYLRNGDVGPDTSLHVAAETGLGIHEHGTLVDGTYAPKDLAYVDIDFISVSFNSASARPSPPTNLRRKPIQ